MAGVGFDALMIRDAGRGMKDRLGRLAYIVTGARHLGEAPTDARIDVDGQRWFTGSLGCALIGNVGSLFGGITVFDDAKPDDGVLQLGVVTAESAVQWVRALARTAIGQPERSPFVEMTSASSIDIRLDKKLPYELDGGDREPTKRLRAEVEPAAIAVCVPEETNGAGG
jgi:diacylglycerol kinase family enzyme